MRLLCLNKSAVRLDSLLFSDRAAAGEPTEVPRRSSDRRPPYWKRQVRLGPMVLQEPRVQAAPREFRACLAFRELPALKARRHAVEVKADRSAGGAVIEGEQFPIA